MGKNLIQQARGKGGPSYRSPKHRSKGASKYSPLGEMIQEKVVGIITSPMHTTPLLRVSKSGKENEHLIIAPEGLKVGDIIEVGPGAAIKPGNVLHLKDIPEGTPVYNIEGQPGDGGKFVRSSGLAARVVTQRKDSVVIQFPSKKFKSFPSRCRATIGIAAAGGRTEKPITKAGNAHFIKRTKNKRYPMISGSAQNAVDHPFGNKRTSRKSKARPAPKFAPPGRKVGMIRPRKSGRGKVKNSSR